MVTASAMLRSVRTMLTLASQTRLRPCLPDQWVRPSMPGLHEGHDARAYDELVDKAQDDDGDYESALGLQSPDEPP